MNKRNSSRCRKMINLLLERDKVHENEDARISADVNETSCLASSTENDHSSSSGRFSQLLGSSICIDGVYEIDETRDVVWVPPISQEEPAMTRQNKPAEFLQKDQAVKQKETAIVSWNEEVRSPHRNNSPISDSILLDISYIPITYEETEIVPMPLTQPNENHGSTLGTPSSRHQNISFIASPTVLFINRDYDLQSISDLENVLQNIENNHSPVHESIDQENRTPSTTLSRKRKINKESWKDVQNKVQKNSGQAYQSVRSNKMNPEKAMGLSCNCRLKCYEKIHENMRKYVFKKFWAIGDHERQWEFIVRYVKKEDIKKMTLERINNRTQTLIYSLPVTEDLNNSVKVCKTMFLNTLSITQSSVYTAVEKLSRELKDLREKHTNRPKKMSERTEQSVIDHINKFAKVESNYIRKDSQKEYLDETLNLSKMHRLYLEWVDTEPQYREVIIATKRQYEYIFNSKFNLAFHKPKKDLCETCTIYKNADDRRKLELKDEYEKHIKAKNLVRELKEKEKQELDKSDSVVACFDLEKVLNIPQSEVGAFHYKRKYPVYNFTVYNILEKKGYSYVWHLQIAKRGAIEIASCLWSYIQSQVELGKKKISNYSDSCTGQNRNRFVFAMLAFASRKFNIQITHRFLEKGHSQSEGDSMHATVERSKKNHTIYNPDQMYCLIENAKVTGTKYEVKQMTQDLIFDFKDLIKGKNRFSDDRNDKIYWSKIKEIYFSVDQPDVIKFKYCLDEPYKEMKIARQNSRRRKDPADHVVQQLKPAYNAMIPVPRLLYKDLISLCDSDTIPAHYQSFYRNLTPTDNCPNEDSDVE